MSVRQDRFTFFGVLIAVVIVVLGYLQLGQLYPVAGRGDDSATKEVPTVDDEPAKDEVEAPREGGSQR